MKCEWLEAPYSKFVPHSTFACSLYNAGVDALYGLLIILSFIKTLVNSNKFTIQQSMYSFY